MPASLFHLSLFTVAISDFSFCQPLSNNNRNPEKEAHDQTKKKATKLKQKMKKTKQNVHPG